MFDPEEPILEERLIFLGGATMSKRLTIIGVMLLVSITAAPAQTPSPEAMSVARSLVATLKLTDQYNALLPVILLSIKPTLVQGRPEIERDYDAMTAQIERCVCAILFLDGRQRRLCLRYQFFGGRVARN